MHKMFIVSKSSQRHLCETLLYVLLLLQGIRDGSDAESSGLPFIWLIDFIIFIVILVTIIQYCKIYIYEDRIEVKKGIMINNQLIYFSDVKQAYFGIPGRPHTEYKKAGLILKKNNRKETELIPLLTEIEGLLCLSRFGIPIEVDLRKSKKWEKRLKPLLEQENVTVINKRIE